MITFCAAGSKAVEFTVAPVKPCPMPVFLHGPQEMLPTWVDG